MNKNFNKTETNVNWTEDQERLHHASLARKITAALTALQENVVSRYDEMIEIKQQLQEHSRDLDHVDKANLRQAADMASRVGEHSIEQRRKLAKLLEAPFFGRIDVTDRTVAGDAQPKPIYIGVHSFSETESEYPLIHDWRAPICSMFYDFELGDAFYEAPKGRIDCLVTLKRQFKIERQKFRFMIESALNIQDNILQEELSRASDDKLKTIVATIQRDQNAIIRNDHAQTLVIQGAAGSGKTSIALHRIAYLLYKHKDTIRSSDILIISPNKVFAHYISQVLPELGEEMIRETTMERLANELLDEKYKFETFTEQVAKLLDGKDEAYAERVRFKATPEFRTQLNRYVEYCRATNLRADGIRIGMITLEANWIANLFRKWSGRPINQQLNGVVNAIVEHMKYQHQKEVMGKDRTRVRQQLRQMFADTNLKTIYKNFYTWMDRPDMYKSGAKGAFEYADVFPLVYLKLMLEGVRTRSEIKHVVIDEMQDYTPVQYQVLAALYPTKMTVLGDRNQSVNPLSASNAESIRDVLPAAECVYLRKSYRSTIQITQVAQSIIHNPDLIPIERHGQPVCLRSFSTKTRELDFVKELVREFAKNDHKSFGIICKTQKQAETVYKHLHGEPGVRLIDAESKLFSSGVMVSTAYLAKGLEYDEILVPFCNDKDFVTAIDRHMLYVAVTRAMHTLTISHHGALTPMLQSAASLMDVSS